MPTVTSKGAQGAVNWSTGVVWVGDSAPVTGDTVVIANGDYIELDGNYSMAQISAAGNTGYITVTNSRTLTLTGAGITYAGTLVTGFIVLSAGTLTITGSGATCLISTTSTGYGMLVTGTAVFKLNNGTDSAISVTTASGRGISSSATSTTNEIIGNITVTSTGVGFYQTTGAGVTIITGNLIGSGGTSGSAITMGAGTVNFSGAMSGLVSVGHISMFGTGAVVWTGTHALANNTDARIYMSAGTLTLGNSTIPLVINNNGARLAILRSGGTMTANPLYCTINNNTKYAQTVLYGATTQFVVTGPSIPAAEDVRSGVVRGYLDDGGVAVSGCGNVSGTCVVPAANEVVSTAVFGPASAIRGTVIIPSPSDVRVGVTYGPEV